MILIEYTYGKLKGKNNYRLNDTITSINIGLLSRFPTILNLGAQGLVYAYVCLLYTSPSPRDVEESRMPSSA